MAPPLYRDGDTWKPRSSSYNFLPSIRLPRRTRRRMLGFWALIVVGIYYCLFAPSDNRRQWEVPSVPSFLQQPSKPIPIRFPNLYKSLSGIRSGWRTNNNVVFAAANLTAASKMAGIACEMATYRRSEVHLALLGFDTLATEEFKELNGLKYLSGDDEGCDVQVHDARAFQGELMSVERRKIAIKSVFRHLGSFMRPQAVFIDTTIEEPWFVEIAREKAGQLGLTLIELPENTMNQLKWITRLDSKSLNAWNWPTFEIVIHADAHVGSLERLLRSISHAYYPSKAHRPTRITVVLDPSIPVHPMTRDFLKSFTFPGRGRISVLRSVLTSDDPMEKAAQFIQTFYSVSEHHSVLFLDPDVELSQWYYHYLLYTTFEYRYSRYHQHETAGLYGISLEPPSNLPSGKKPFDISNLEGPLFLHTAPNPRAALYFSDHWSEFHSYFSHRLRPEFEVLPLPDHEKPGPTPKTLQISKTHANSWTGSFIELARARGYVMIYPLLSEPLAIVHTETLNSEHRSKTPHPERRLLQQPFPDALPAEDLPEWNKIPVVNLWGEKNRDLETDGLLFRDWISTCPKDIFPTKWGVEDLFCDGKGRSV